MIAKCLALLAVVAQISASSCNEVIVPSCGSSVSGSQIVLGSSGISDISGVSGLIGGFSTGAGVPTFSAGTEVPTFSAGTGVSTFSAGTGVPTFSVGTGATVKNLVASGRFPVALSNCGPNPDPRVPVTTSAVSAPLQEKPTVRIPCNIPAPRTISHSCTCYKTIVKPRVHQQVITVPSVQRYVQTTHKPVVENIQYEALPVNCRGETGVSGSSVQLFGVSSAPQVQTVSVPQVQTVSVPQVQTVTVPQVQTVSVPQVQTVNVPQIQTVAVPQVQTVSVPQVQAIEIPQTVSLGSSCTC